MSKSYNNFIALEDNPKDMFGKIMRISDELMVRYYELLTDINVDDLSDLKNRKGRFQGENPQRHKDKIS